MSSKNTRAISVSRLHYRDIAAAAKARGVTINSLVEAAVVSEPAFAAFNAGLPPARPIRRQRRKGKRPC